MPGDDLNEALRTFLRVGVFIGLGGVILALAITPNTAEHVLSVCSSMIGIVIIAGVVIVRRLTSR